ncbi:hypothetical protein MTR_3g467670 [Medicago truncatula]|uniref:Reverse transcriptase domain-containing protein n=1 Tax=Medicago truncatula TaxID=3880 RepID=A0A072UYJ9_MEDTR|nr:hypothetical protein MTR_3g467670 [Medicago truncatula]
MKPFSLEEVKAIVWDCDSFKSSGHDGINFGLIKDFLHDMKDEIMKFVSEFHRNGINTTFIALIPKVDSPKKFNDFQPISLSAFVKNRQILDEILIANEVVDECRKFQKDLMLFKLDFEKAYDSMVGVGSSVCAFRRLFDLYENKSITVVNWFSLGVEKGEAWKWRQRLWAWEEEVLEECKTLLLDVSLHVNVLDWLLWLPHPSGGYSVRGVYQLLTVKDIPLANSAAAMIWHTSSVKGLSFCVEAAM